MGTNNEIVSVDADLNAETDLAWLIDDGMSREWIPKSRCVCDSDDPDKGQTYEFEIPEWLAIEKGFA